MDFIKLVRPILMILIFLSKQNINAKINILPRVNAHKINCNQF